LGTKFNPGKLIILAVIVAGLLLASCSKSTPTISSSKTSATSAAAATTTSKATTSAAASTAPATLATTTSKAATTSATTVATTTSKAGTTSSSGGDTLSSILAKTGSNGAMTFDMVMTIPSQPVLTEKVQVKNNKMRAEMTVSGQTIISFIDTSAKTMIQYMPAQNIATVMDYSKAPSSPTDTNSLQSYNPVVTGTETIDGKVCMVIEYTTSQGKTKAWIWKDRGFPIRIEATTSQGLTVIEYKNIVFADIADSVFQLPAGATTMSIPSIPSIPGYPTK
jgi:hypothetical protein